MRSVNVAELKNRLSAYLAAVREGEEILVRDRDLPIAKIVPLRPAETIDEDERVLAAAGKLKLAEAPLPKSFWTMPAPRISLKRAAQAVIADRDEGR
jgi:prevent-host-death family protein